MMTNIQYLCYNYKKKCFNYINDNCDSQRGILLDYEYTV